MQNVKVHKISQATVERCFLYCLEIVIDLQRFRIIIEFDSSEEVMFFPQFLTLTFPIINCSLKAVKAIKTYFPSVACSCNNEFASSDRPCLWKR